MKHVDRVAFTEACYRLDLDLRAWMTLISGLVAPEFDHGFGVTSWLVRLPSRFKAEPVGPAVVVGGPPELAEVARAMSFQANPAEVRASFLSGRPFRSGSELGLPPTNGILQRHPNAAGMRDALGLATVDGEGFALSFAAMTQELVRTSLADRARWLPLTAHLAAGFRLRRRLSGLAELEQGVEAVFTPEGKCLDARGAAQGAREVLRSAVRAVERSRGPLRRKRPTEALQLWQGLVSGAWSLVDTFSSEGKRYVVARRNAPSLKDPRALSEPERQVVNFAAAGQSNKLIAYTLGLAPSTVATHLTSAGRKLRIASRAEFARLHAINDDLAEVQRLEVGGEPLTTLILPLDRLRYEHAGLTSAEREVTEAIVTGATNAQIAAQRKRSVRTVANQVASLLRKLEVGSRTELVTRLASAPPSK